MSLLPQASALAACAVLLAGPAYALRAEVTDAGEVTADRERPALPHPGDETLSPRVNIDGIRFIGRDKDLAAQLCLHFGVRIRLLPDPGEAVPDTLTVVSTHPRLTRPDGVSATQERFTTAVDGAMAYAGWTFDKPWEVRGGDWTIAFQHDGATLAAETFHITVPRPLGSLCQAPPTS